MPKINFIQKLRASYHREIQSKPEPNIVFTAVLAFVVTLGLWIYAIRPELKSMRNTVDKLAEINQISKNMDVKINSIDAGLDVMETSRQQILNLQSSIPQETMLNDYLQQVVEITSKSGFVVDSLVQADVFEDTVTLKLNLTGSNSGLPELIRELEDLNRITTVKEVRSQVSEENTIFELTLEIYKI